MFGYNMFRGPFPQRFKTQYRCYSVSMLSVPRADLESGGKIIMPPSALDTLEKLSIEYPMLFKLSSKKNAEKVTHCGVLEFVADEGKIHIPYWMMQNLLLEEGDLIEIESASLPVATYSKFQPQNVDFLDISNPKAVLENVLRSFACLTNGDLIAIKYNKKVYELLVLETKPSNAVSIIECDMSVEFAPPVGYVEPQKPKVNHHDQEDMQVDGQDHAKEFVEQNTFMAFTGEGRRLDGKTKNTKSEPVPLEPLIYKRGVPNYDYKRGTLTFIRSVKPSTMNTAEETEEVLFKPFTGEGQVLKKKRTKKP
ncbi:ubiquitin recognition factor in ER-associated degradation protein 1-like [Apostichopus japonicus]